MCENENKMYINITAEDYFNELKLMQQHLLHEKIRCYAVLFEIAISLPFLVMTPFRCI